jgi:hypothetical protein
MMIMMMESVIGIPLRAEQPHILVHQGRKRGPGNIWQKKQAGRPWYFIGQPDVNTSASHKNKIRIIPSKGESKPKDPR